MAEDSGQEKSEEPTQKRLDDAKKKGQIARSRELNTFVMLIISAWLLISQGGQVGQGLIELMQRNFHVSRETIFEPLTTIVFFKQAMHDGLLLIVPLMVILTVTAIIAPIALGGWIFNMDTITPKFDKLDPIKGLPKLFSVNGLVELLKASLKIALVGLVGWLLFNSIFAELLGLSSEPMEQAVIHAVKLIAHSFLILSGALILVAAIDVPYQLHKHSTDLKMSMQEIKDEHKEAEGSPEIKGRIRRTQMEMAQNRMMKEVPNADVIITNPSHYAIALKYDEGSGNAPILVAKGVDLIAAHIRNLAIEANVPLVAAPPLARALYYSTELDNEIPQGLYLAVAQVLAYIFQLKEAAKTHGTKPAAPKDIKVPSEFKQE
ncbi:MAG: flagellar biosynthesis protein FlhB [Methylococcaceae bacterium]|jgi:flagellar biosynthetic protein FlhB